MFFKKLKQQKQSLISDIISLDEKYQEMLKEATVKELELLMLDTNKKLQDMAMAQVEEQIKVLVLQELLSLKEVSSIRSSHRLKAEAYKAVRLHKTSFKRRPVNRSLRKLIINRDKCCLNCGAAENLTIDHIVPVVFGGENVYENLQTLCFSCNSSKNKSTIDLRKS